MRYVVLAPQSLPRFAMMLLASPRTTQPSSTVRLGSAWWSAEWSITTIMTTTIISSVTIIIIIIIITSSLTQSNHTEIIKKSGIKWGYFSSKTPETSALSGFLATDDRAFQSPVATRKAPTRFFSVGAARCCNFKQVTREGFTVSTCQGVTAWGFSVSWQKSGWELFDVSLFRKLCMRTFFYWEKKHAVTILVKV